MVAKYANMIKVTEKSKFKRQHLFECDHSRYGFSLANYRNSHIYITGGWVDKMSKTVLVFDLANNTIQSAPDMNHTRMNHGCTSLGD